MLSLRGTEQELRDGGQLARDHWGLLVGLGKPPSVAAFAQPKPLICVFSRYLLWSRLREPRTGHPKELVNEIPVLGGAWTPADKTDAAFEKSQHWLLRVAGGAGSGATLTMMLSALVFLGGYVRACFLPGEADMQMGGVQGVKNEGKEIPISDGN